MERIYKNNRKTLIDFKCDGEFFYIYYKGELLFSPLHINPREQGQKFNSVKGRQMKLKALEAPKKVKSEFEKFGKVVFNVEAKHFTQRSISIDEEAFELEDTLINTTRGSIFWWFFQTEYDFHILKNTPDYFKVKIDDIILEIWPSEEMGLREEDDGFALVRRPNTAKDYKSKMLFKFTTPTQIMTSSIQPNVFKKDKQVLPYIADIAGYKQIDVILSPLPFTEVDLLTLSENELKQSLAHIPYQSQFARRKTDKIFIFDNFNNQPSLYLAEFEKFSKTLRYLVAKLRVDEEVQVNLIGCDVAAMAAYKMIDYDMYNKVCLINPVVNLQSLFANSPEQMKKYFPIELFEKTCDQLKNDLYNTKLRIVTSPYERGYYDFMRLLESLEYDQIKKMKINIIRSSDNIDDDMQFAKIIKKM